jgi:hypothetical protein
MRIPCGRGCPDRNAECHAICERYREYRKVKDKEAVERQRRREADAELSEMSRKRADRIQRYTKRDIKINNRGR